MNLSRLVPALPLLAVLSFPALAPASEDDSAAIKKAEAAMDMQGGDFALAAQVSAVAAASGAAAAAKYTQGVAVFTAGESGLMFQASVGGQGFGFTPFGEKKKQQGRHPARRASHAAARLGQRPAAPQGMQTGSAKGASMKHLLRATALGLAALAISSCATTSLVQVWRDPNYRPAPIKRVVVVAVIPYAQDRLLFENAIAQSLASKGLEVATSAGIVPPDQSDNDKIVAYVKDMGADLVVVLRLVTPYGTWLGATDINVYAARTNSQWPVWSGTTNTSNFSTGQEAATSVAASLLYSLAKANILVR